MARVTAPYRLHVLGGLYLTRAGIIIEGPATTRKPLALLAMVAVAGELGVTRDRLAGHLWGESGESQARSQLKQLLYLIGKEFGKRRLVVGKETLRLNPETCGSDIDDLRSALREVRIRDVAALYRGPLLEGVFLDDNSAYQRWVDSEQSRLINRVQAAIRLEAKKLESLGKHAEAVELWSALVEQEPLSDINELGLVRALVAAGDRAAAMRHARGYGALLRRELETEPSPEIASALKAVRETV